MDNLTRVDTEDLTIVNSSTQAQPGATIGSGSKLGKLLLSCEQFLSQPGATIGKFTIVTL